jgi:MFS family permease
LVLASALFFAVGSVVAAVANNFTMMIIGRSVQGIGGGGILTLGEILVTDLVPLSVRGGMFSSPHQNVITDIPQLGLDTLVLCGPLDP